MKFAEQEEYLGLTPEGIAGFTQTFLIGRYDESTGAVAPLHMDMWGYCCSDSPRVALAVPRGHAKSTSVTFAYALASTVFRATHHTLIISSTEDMASDYVGAIKTELQENEKLASFFRFKRLVKDSESEIIGQFMDGHKFRFLAKGAGQKMRGTKWEHSRPDLVLVDDVEDDEIVMNQDRRRKFKRWFYGAVRPILGNSGKIRVVGTILHLDSMLENLMPKPDSPTTVVEGLKTYSTSLKKGQWLAVKYKAHTPDFSEILWPAMFNKEKLQQIRDEFIDQGLLDLYNQEYLNDPIDDSTSYFKSEWFHSPPAEENWARRPKKYYIAADLAISTSDKANFTAFIVAALDDLGRLEVVHARRGRWDGLEILENIFELQKRYSPEVFAIEKGQIELALGPFLNSEQRRRGIFIPLRAVPAKGDKESRAKSIQGRMRMGDVYFQKDNDWYDSYFDELHKFPRGKNDDYVDATAHLGAILDTMVAPQSKEEQDEEEYWSDRYATEGTYGSGASEITGY